MHKEKLVTIGLPLYNSISRNNGDGLLRSAIDSLLAQTYQNFELILSDNASADGTETMCREYEKKDSRIRYIRHGKNEGQLKNIYFVVREARGDYFMLASDDDYREPYCIEKLIAPLERNPRYQVCMGSFDRFYDNGVLKDHVRLAGDLDVTDQSFFSVYKKILFDAPLHIYLYGLFRTPFLQKIFSRPAPRCIRWDRPMLAEIALATPFYAAADKVFRKQYKKKVGRIRYADEQVGGMFYQPFRYTKYTWMMFWRPFSSPVVPFHRKIGQIPIWLRFAFANRKRIRKEIVREAKKSLQ